MANDECLLCRVSDADAYFGRRRVWQDGYWRLSVVLHGAVVGFAHLEPHRPNRARATSPTGGSDG
jgi:hypothetical protein